MPNSGYFDTKRDIEIEKAGGFWCHTCLVSHPATEQSPDPRYCQGCYEFLLKEAEMLSPGKYPKWIPKPQRTQENQCPIAKYGSGVLAATKAIPAKTPPRVGGRPVLDLPFELIKELQDQGYGATEIRRQLKDKDIEVSMRTLYRVLSGQQVME